MCFEWKNRFTCGHVGFRKVERCNSLGSGCFGPDGTEKFVDIESLCYDCSARLQQDHPASGTAQSNPFAARDAADAAGAGTWAWARPGTVARSGSWSAAGSGGDKPQAGELGGGGRSETWGMSPSVSSGISPGVLPGMSPDVSSGMSSGMSPGT
ncbi:hypothetical protein VTG60DRAFT_3353 [Thermothelomyces hinnuleus]